MWRLIDTQTAIKLYDSNISELRKMPFENELPVLEWKRFIKRIGKRRTLRALLEFMPLAKTFSEVKKPRYIENYEKSAIYSIEEFDHEELLELLIDWSENENYLTKEKIEILMQKVALETRNNYSLYLYFLLSLGSLVVEKNRFYEHFFTAIRAINGQCGDRWRIKECIMYKVAVDIVDGCS